MLRGIKSELVLPEFMHLAYIVAVYKGKGGRMELSSERGIFIVNLFRSILMKLVYQDKYDTVDNSMSDSNVGARKKKNIRNHIFVINGIINEAIKNEKDIDIQILDYRQCFDGMWLDECINDLYEAGITDDSLALIYEANKNNQVAVKTPFGLTNRECVNKIVLQGEVFGPLQCSVQVDSFGKECLLENKHLYYYRGKVGVSPLAMVDDLLEVSNCGIETVKTNGFLNAKTNVKKLQFGGDKCHKMHVGKKHHLCPDVFVDNWELEKIDKNGHGIKNLEDIYVGDLMMDSVDNEKYLGDIIAADGSNTKNLQKRKSKGESAVSQIMSILQNTCFGPYYFQVAIILRNSILANGILTNSEAWYGLNDSDLEILESVDEQLMRRVLEVPSTCPKEMLYLEMGCVPFKYIVASRRLNFLHYILNEDESSLIYKVLKSQSEQPVKDDWYLSVVKDLEEFQLDMDLEEIKELSSFSFHKTVQKSACQKALMDLTKIKLKHTKVKHILHEKLSMQQYLKPNQLTISETKFAFHARTRMLRVKRNYGQSSEDKFCPVCKDKNTDDSQDHLLVCEVLVQKNQLIVEVPEYQDLFCDKIEKLVKITRILQSNYLERIEILKKEKEGKH